MWQSRITNKVFNNGVLLVDVQFYNEDSSIIKSIDMTGGSLDVLSQKIQSQIDTLNATDDLVSQIQTGEFTPNIPEVDPEIQAISDLQKAKQLVDLGLITTDDIQYTTALSTAQGAVKTSTHIGSIEKGI